MRFAAVCSRFGVVAIGATLLVFVAIATCCRAQFTGTGRDTSPSQLNEQFQATVQPFVQTYCISCHGKEKPKADFDMTVYSSMSSLTLDGQRSSGILDRIEANEMPPKKAKLHPSDELRGQVVAWFHATRDYEARRNAGDPGIVLARRLNNTEYDDTIRDLTGVDIQPAREFPEDPSSAADLTIPASRW